MSDDAHNWWKLVDRAMFVICDQCTVHFPAGSTTSQLKSSCMIANYFSKANAYRTPRQMQQVEPPVEEAGPLQNNPSTPSHSLPSSKLNFTDCSISSLRSQLKHLQLCQQLPSVLDVLVIVVTWVFVLFLYLISILQIAHRNLIGEWRYGSESIDGTLSFKPRRFS